MSARDYRGEEGTQPQVTDLLEDSQLKNNLWHTISERFSIRTA